MGVDNLFVPAFNAELAQKSAEAFVVEVLSEGLESPMWSSAMIRLRPGPPRHRGADGRSCRLHGFGVTALPPVGGGQGEVFSSTACARTCRRRGRCRPAPCSDGPGRSRAGSSTARSSARPRLPTANLMLGEYLQPALGIYAVQGRHRRGARDGLA